MTLHVGLDAKRLAATRIGARVSCGTTSAKDRRLGQKALTFIPGVRVHVRLQRARSSITIVSDEHQ